jgi:hypothetical protein
MNLSITLMDVLRHEFLIFKEWNETKSLALAIAYPLEKYKLRRELGCVIRDVDFFKNYDGDRILMNNVGNLIDKYQNSISEFGVVHFQSSLINLDEVYKSAVDENGIYLVKMIIPKDYFKKEQVKSNFCQEYLDKVGLEFLAVVKNNEKHNLLPCWMAANYNFLNKTNEESFEMYGDSLALLVDEAVLTLKSK